MKSDAMNTPRPLSLRTLLTTGVLSVAASTALAFSHPATIQIDGRSVNSDVPPVVTASRQYLPLRAVTAQLGGRVSYDKKTRAIIVVRGADRLKLHLGKQTAILNGKTMHLTHAPFAVRGRTMVAAKTIERALGPKVQYNPRKSTIDVVTAEAPDATGEKEGSASAF
jgi:hypothetical protein